MNKKIIFPVAFFLTLPLVVFGQSCPGGDCRNWVKTIMSGVGNAVWQIFAGITVVMFIVAGILFATSNGEPGKITTAKNAVIWGVVGIVAASLAFIIVNTVAGWA